MKEGEKTDSPNYENKIPAFLWKKSSCLKSDLAANFIWHDLHDALRKMEFICHDELFILKKKREPTGEGSMLGKMFNRKIYFLKKV